MVPDRSSHDEAGDAHGAALAEAVHAADRLRLQRRVQARLEQENLTPPWGTEEESGGPRRDATEARRPMRQVRSQRGPNTRAPFVSPSLMHFKGEVGAKATPDSAL